MKIWVFFCLDDEDLTEMEYSRSTTKLMALQKTKISKNDFSTTHLKRNEKIFNVFAGGEHIPDFIARRLCFHFFKICLHDQNFLFFCRK